MAFESWSAFIAMGKHGPFVWSAYGITLVVLVANVVAPIVRKKRLQQAIARKVKRDQAEL